MPFAFILVGILFVVSGAKGNTNQLIKLVKGDLTGTNGYIYWAISIFAIGSLGYIPELKTLSRWFLALVLVVLVLKTGNTNRSGGGFFTQFTAALQKITGSQNQANGPYGPNSD